MKYSKILFSILILSIFSSCTGDEECRQNKYVMLEAGLYHVTYNDVTNTRSSSAISVDSVTIQGIEIDSITGKGTLVDSLLYNNVSVSKIYLPLHKFRQLSKFLLDFNGVIDTLTIYHTNYEQYLSLECGCIKTHNIDTIQVTNHFIDSARIVIHNVNTTNAEHIQLYH